MTILNSQKKKNLLIVFLLGVISFSSYIVAFYYESYITQMFTKGGWNGIFPLAVVFYFSFLHGSFASKILNILGIKASEKCTS